MNSNPQVWHKCAQLACFSRTCKLKALVLLNRLPHSLQTIVLTFVWTELCLFKYEGNFVVYVHKGQQCISAFLFMLHASDYNGGTLFSFLSSIGARQPPTHAGALRRYLYSSYCSGPSQLQSSKQLSSTPINLKHNSVCLQTISGRQEESGHEHCGGHKSWSSKISTSYTSETPLH